MSKSLEIGAYSRNGLYQITDTNWDNNGTLSVTVREMIGEREMPKPRLEAMRRFARRALPEYREGQTKSAATVRTWFANGQSHATFAVSRLDHYLKLQEKHNAKDTRTLSPHGRHAQSCLQGCC